MLNLLSLIMLFNLITLKAVYSVTTVTSTLHDAQLCAAHGDHIERLRNMPTRLLAAISKVESGRYDKISKQVIAWPWTINVQGKDYYFSTKTAAVDYVRNLMKQGIKSIDVGCMQVNLHYHPQAFNSLEDAFDPYTNTAYAASFLMNLRNSLGSWNQAVAHYHSANAQYHIPYRQKVIEAWLKEGGINPALSVSPGMVYGQYNVTYGPQGKIYRKASLEELRTQRKNHPQWRMSEARYYLNKYRKRIEQTLSSPPANTSIRSVSLSTTARVIRQASTLPNKALNTKSLDQNIDVMAAQVQSSQGKLYIIKANQK